MEEPEHRHFILQIALKCADISNPCRPWDISRKWAYKVCEEFFRQGDYERQLNLPVTALCDRHTTSIPKIQVGFFKFMVLPLYEEWHRFLDDAFSRSLIQYLLDNQRHWEMLIQQEVTSAQPDSEMHTEPVEPSEVSLLHSFNYLNHICVALFVTFIHRSNCALNTLFGAELGNDTLESRFNALE